MVAFSKLATPLLQATTLITSVSAKGWHYNVDFTRHKSVDCKGGYAPSDLIEGEKRVNQGQCTSWYDGQTFVGGGFVWRYHLGKSYEHASKYGECMFVFYGQDDCLGPRVGHVPNINRVEQDFQGMPCVGNFGEAVSMTIECTKDHYK